MGHLLRVSEVAERLRCSTSNVYALLAQGRLKHFRVGAGKAGIRCSEEHVAEYLRSAERGGRPDEPPAPEKAPAGGFSVLDADRLKEAWRGRLP